MAQNNNTKLLKIILLIYAIVSFIYGICFVFIPQVLVNLSGAEAVSLAWLRWPGGVLIALGIGAVMVYQNPVQQNPFVTTIGLGSLFTGLILLFALIFERTGKAWFTALPMIIVLVESVLLWISRAQAKSILGHGQEEASQ